jgi:integrase
MALVKRGKTWHTHFFVDGQRFRQSLETSDWREAQKKEKQLVAQASQGKLAPLSHQFSKFTFKEAADKNLAERIAHLAPRSVQTERERLRPLCAVFGSIKVHRITVEMVRTYAADRKAANVANKTINLEIGVLRGVIKRAKLWHLFADEIKPLPVRTQIGRAMTLDERLRLAKTAEMKPEWQNARLAMVLALNTTMRSCEIKAIRWRDVDFLARTITIRRSKTEAGQRMIPLNQDALSAMRELYCRASALGGTHPEHYLFPACENGRCDPMSPRRAGVRPGGACGEPQGLLRCASMTSGIMQSQSWPSLRPVTRPSWPSLVTCPGRCLSTTPTFALISSGKHWMRSRLAGAILRASQQVTTQTTTQDSLQAKAATR